MSEEFDRTPADIMKKLEDIRYRILWSLHYIIIQLILVSSPSTTTQCSTWWMNLMMMMWVLHSLDDPSKYRIDLALPGLLESNYNFMLTMALFTATIFCAAWSSFWLHLFMKTAMGTSYKPMCITWSPKSESVMIFSNSIKVYSNISVFNASMTYINPWLP